MQAVTCLATLVVACHHEPPAPAPPIAHGILLEAPDPRCEDEDIGALHSTDASYMVTADELVGRTMRDHRVDFTRCLLHRQRYLPDVAGKVVVTIRIDAAGHVSHVQTRGPDAELDRCICAAVLPLGFGPLTSSTVTYPLYFAP